MTRNQTKAVELARRLITGQIASERLPDPDWELLLLASGVTDPRSQAYIVGHRVLQNCQAGIGYFMALGRPRGNAMLPAAG